MRELSVAAKREKINDVVDFVYSFLDELGCKDEIKTKFAIAVDEIFVNIASYAYAHDHGTATIKCYANNDRTEVKIEFVDEGIEFNPLKKDDPVFGLELEDMQIGGLGIFMVKEMMDTVEYERHDNKNIFTISQKC